MRPGALAFPVFCLLLSLFVLLTDPGFTYQLTGEEGTAPTRQLLGYFAGTHELPGVFNEQEQQHLQDVKRALHGAFALLLISFLVLVLDRTYWQANAIHGTTLLIALVFIGTLAPFDALFTLFHHFAFPHGNWQFPADSTLITLYPQSFFVSYTLAIALHAILIAAFFAKLSHTWDEKSS